MTLESEAAMKPGDISSKVEEVPSVQAEVSTETISTPEKVVSIWENVVEHPKEWLVDLLDHESEQKIAFVAGGGLPLLFGADNDLWHYMVQSMKDGVLQIAGVDFTVAELTSIGDFYRFMSHQGISLHCIDERCIDDLHHAGTQVHEHCGACAAVAAAIEAVAGKIDVETVVHTHLTKNDQRDKQPIHPEMKEAHASMVVLIDLSGADVVKPEVRDALREHDALPFNVSLPLDMVQVYIDQLPIDENEIDEEVTRLIPALVKWNVQIACNIIKGHHNLLKEHSEGTQLVVDERETDGPGAHLKKHVLAVPLMRNSKKLVIRDADPAA